MRPLPGLVAGTHTLSSQVIDFCLIMVDNQDVSMVAIPEK